MASGGMTATKYTNNTTTAAHYPADIKIRVSPTIKPTIDILVTREDKGEKTKSTLINLNYLEATQLRALLDYRIGEAWGTD